MYYIINENNQIIAADQSFLGLIGVEDITQIYHKIAQGDISLEYNNDKLNLKTSSSTEEYITVKTSLNSLLGNLYVIECKKSLEDESVIPEDSIKDDVDMGVSNDILDDIFEEDEISVEDDVPTEEEDSVVDDNSDDILLDDNFLLADEDKVDDTQEVSEKEEIESNEDEIFDLLLTSDDNAPLISLSSEDHIDTEAFEKTPEEIIEETPEETFKEPIVLDIDTLSKTIGISTDDYNSFFDEYKETAMSLESDIRSGDSEKRRSAIQTLQHLSGVLHIPVVSELLDKFDANENEELVEELYGTLSRLTTQKAASTQAVVEEKHIETEIPQETEKPTKESVQESSAGSKHKIDLSDVTPIHFDFSMEQAANELSLPVDLIDEFVHDFIDQAHEETENMLSAYDNGDLDRVNKLGHLLKGTSSNLRITPLADTLYKIQFCESLEELEPLIKDYWGHFLAFEKHIKMRTN